MKTKLTLMSITLLGLLLISCKSNETSDSNKVAQSEIYQSYFVEYDASQMSLKLRPASDLGEKTEPLYGWWIKSNVSYNNNTMSAQTSAWTGTSYVYKRNGAVAVEHTFLYVNNDNESFKNIIPLMPAEPILENTTISKSKRICDLLDGRSSLI